MINRKVEEEEEEMVDDDEEYYSAFVATKRTKRRGTSRVKQNTLLINPYVQKIIL